MNVNTTTNSYSLYIDLLIHSMRYATSLEQSQVNGVEACVCVLVCVCVCVCVHVCVGLNSLKSMEWKLLCVCVCARVCRLKQSQVNGVEACVCACVCVCSGFIHAVEIYTYMYMYACYTIKAKSIEKFHRPCLSICTIHGSQNVLV